MFADAKTNTYGWNTSGWHVFGNADMRDCWAPQYWYNYSGTYPSSGGVSVKTVSDILIYSNKAPPVGPSAAFISNTQSGTVPLTVQFTDQSTGTSPLMYAWDFNNDGTVDSTIQNPSHTYSSAGTYTVNLTVTNGAGSDSEVKTSYITVNPVPIDEWTITLNGQVNEQLTRVTFESLATGNRLTYTDASGTWSGIALWRLLARVDDSDPTTYNDALAALGYTVNVSASDFSSLTSSQILARNNTWIVADTLNGTPLPKQIGGKNNWPLKIVGTGLSGSKKVGNITRIALSDFVTPPSAPIAGFTAVPLT
jgi:PKD repeat protein